MNIEKLVKLIKGDLQVMVNRVEFLTQQKQNIEIEIENLNKVIEEYSEALKDN